MEEQNGHRDNGVQFGLIRKAQQYEVTTLTGIGHASVQAVVPGSGREPSSCWSLTDCGAKVGLSRIARVPHEPYTFTDKE